VIAYSATKWAVEGLVESLMYEVESLGVKVTVVQPGLSRRDEYVCSPDPCTCLLTFFLLFQDQTRLWVAALHPFGATLS
jgi:NAD(P)-dependent dehydrogenase (short-subunit alcohol dehydrogenase family)